MHQLIMKKSLLLSAFLIFAFTSELMAQGLVFDPEEGQDYGTTTKAFATLIMVCIYLWIIHSFRQDKRQSMSDERLRKAREKEKEI